MSTGGRTALAERRTTFAGLSGRFDVVVCEGAGTPAEINLRAHDTPTWGWPGTPRLPVILVGDIDRGGVFALSARWRCSTRPTRRWLAASYQPLPW